MNPSEMPLAAIAFLCSFCLVCEYLCSSESSHQITSSYHCNSTFLLCSPVLQGMQCVVQRKFPLEPWSTAFLQSKKSFCLQNFLHPPLLYVIDAYLNSYMLSTASEVYQICTKKGKFCLSCWISIRL